MKKIILFTIIALTMFVAVSPVVNGQISVSAQNSPIKVSKMRELNIEVHGPDQLFKFGIKDGYFYLLEGDKCIKLETGLEAYSKPLAVAKSFIGRYEGSDQQIFLVFVEEDDSIQEALFDIKMKEVVAISNW